MTTRETEALSSAVHGRVTLPRDPGYDDERRGFNLAVDQRPAAIVRAADADDVAATVRFAAGAGMRVAPQATGHGSEGMRDLSTSILLKTAALDEISVDEADAIARIGAGATAGDIAAAAGEHRFSAPLGLAPTVGATGLALGGGLGWFSRCHGFTCNNVRAFEVVTAAGDRTRVDDTTHPDLFWALRGGGGRFALVTGLELELRPAGDVSAGMLAWPAERAGEILERFRRWTGEAPQALTAILRYLSVPPVPAIPEPIRGRRIVALLAAYLGDATDAAELLSAWRRDTLIDTFGAVAPAGLVRVAGDPEQPVPSRGDGLLLGDLALGATERLAGLIENDGLGALTVLELRHLGGAVARREPTHGALGAVSERYAVFAAGAAPTPEAARAVADDLTVVRETLEPWASPRILLNSAGAGTDTSRAFEPETWRRLNAIKQSYDPQDVIQAGHS